MTDPVALPLWLVVVLAALAAWALLERLLVPGVRWFLRRRIERVVEEVNRRLAIEIRPFQRTRRRVLIDRLAWDAKVLAAVDEAVAEGVPRAVAMARVGRYAREIVPSFNAYAYFRVGTLLARRLVRALSPARPASSSPPLAPLRLRLRRLRPPAVAHRLARRARRRAGRDGARAADRPGDGAGRRADGAGRRGRAGRPGGAGGAGDPRPAGGGDWRR